jgi:signal transduction histidine kinase/CheY-like chemotaxis protein
MGPAGRRRVRGGAIVAAVVLVYVAGAVIAGPRGLWRHIWADAWWTVVSAYAAIECWATAKRVAAAHRRSAWRWFAAGAAAWFVGMLIWDFNELGAGWLTPFPSVADVFFDAIALAFVIACYRYGQDRPSVALSFKQAGDLGLIGCVLVPVAALALYGPVMESRDDGVYVFAALAYPVLHGSALVFGLLCWWQHVWGQWRWVLGLQLAAIGLLAVVTTLYAESLLGRRYEAGAAMDPVWVACFAIMAWAAREERAIVREVGEEAEERIDEVPAADAIVPALAVGIAVIAALAFRDRWRGPMILVGAVAGIGLAIAIGVRLAASQRLERALRERVRVDADRAKRLELQLMHAQRLQAIGALAGGVAHDFRNLVQIMIAGLAMAQQRIARGQAANNMLDEVERAMWRAADLSARLLELSRRSPSAARVKTVDPVRLVQGVSQLLSKVVPKGVELVVEPEPHVPAVAVDPAGLEHALINLGLNARDAMKGRTGTIRISVETGGAPGIAGLAVILRVDDDGPGIEPDALPRVFEPFFTTKPAGEGTGLGLATVEALAAEHGGVVRACNRTGGGARFELALPAIAAAEAPAREPPPSRGGTVLVVDSDEAHSLIVGGALERHGFRVVVARSREDALAAANDDIAVVVADAGSGLVGNEALAQLRAAGCEAPVILVTGAEGPASGDYAAVVPKSQDPDPVIIAVQTAARAA